MNKHLYQKIAMSLAILLLVALSTTLSTYADQESADVTVGKFTYSDLNSQKKTATITGIASGYESSISNLTIPSTVKKDGVTYNVTKIASSSFMDYYRITSVEIPATVTEIGNYAFCGSDNITKVTIPKSVTFIGPSAFWSANGSITFSFDSTNTVLTMKDQAIYRKSDGYLMNATQATSIPSGVKIIPDSCLVSNFRVTKLELPEGLTTIGANAFENCLRLTEIYIPSSVTSIGNYAFHQTQGSMVIKGYKNSAIDKYVINNNNVYSKKLTFVPVIDTVKFFANGGSGTMADMKVSYLSTQKLTRNTFTRDGYGFAGWNTKEDGSGTKYEDAASINRLVISGTNTLNLYAQWKEGARYTVIFDGNGATSGSMSALNLTIGTENTLPKNEFVKNGYTFAGWNTKADGSGSSYSDRATVKNLSTKEGAKVSLYAQWKLITYKISYELNGGKNASSNPAKYTITTDTIKFADPKRTGYKFAGWYSDAKYKTKVTAILKGSTGNVTLYAKWKPISYKIVLAANGATGKMTAITAKYDEKITLPKCTFKRTGYKFLGWSTNGKAKKATYKNGAKVSNLTKVDGEKVKLYAIWQKK